MNTDKVKIFQDEFDKSNKDWWLSSQELIKLEKLFKQIPKNKQEEFLTKKDTLAEPLKSFVEWLKNSKNNLKNSAENNNSKFWFNSLEKNFEKTENTKDFLNILWNYVDTQLVWNFSNIEKDNIKLIILWEVENKISSSNLIWGFISSFVEPFKKSISSFNNKNKTNKLEELKKIKKDFSKFLDNLGLKTIFKDIESKIVTINEKKKENISFVDTKKVVESLDIKELKGLDSKEIFKKITADTTALSSKLEWLRWTWKELSKAIESTWFWDTINWFLKWLTEGEGFFATIMKIILWALFWKDFLSESSGNQKKSLSNLEKFSDTKDFPLNIKVDEIKKLDQKKLEKFYKYLDSKDIDYSTETFWQELLTWKSENKSENKKVVEIYELLKNEDWKILTEKQDLDDLVGKLNSLEQLDSKIRQKELEQQVEEAEQIANVTQKVASVSWFASVEDSDWNKNSVDKKNTKEEVINDNIDSAKDTKIDKTKQDSSVNNDTQNNQDKKFINDWSLKQNNTKEQRKDKVKVDKVKVDKLEKQTQVSEKEKLEKLQNVLSKEKLSDFFKDNFDLNKYEKIKLSEGITLEEYREKWKLSYLKSEYKKAYEWINTLWDLLKKWGEVNNTIQEIKNRIKYIKNLNLDTLKKDLKFNNWIFKLDHWIKYRYKIEKTNKLAQIKEDISIKSISVENNKMKFYLEWIVNLFVDIDLSEDPMIIEDIELKSIIDNKNENIIKIKNRIWFFVLERI